MTDLELLRVLGGVLGCSRSTAARSRGVTVMGIGSIGPREAARKKAGPSGIVPESALFEFLNGGVAPPERTWPTGRGAGWVSVDDGEADRLPLFRVDPMASNKSACKEGGSPEPV